ncbi:MAG TPA: single-stranded DNA-binding protein [Candidatus Absconditabacterales bacterium]|nr:single-stranded DNA-binding protein [Candidatus Absconditabacterales bacterium]
MDLNKVQLIGRATSDLEVKTIESSGTSVVNFTIVTNRKFKNRDGNAVEEAEYHRCVAYGKGAEVLGQYVNKGKRIYVEGRLRTRKWQDTEGRDRYSTEVIIDNFIFLDSARNDSSDNDSDKKVEEVPKENPEDEEVPF